MSARSVSSIQKDSTPLSSSRLDSVLSIGTGAEASPAPADGPLSRSVVVLKFERVDSFTKKKAVVYNFVTANRKLLWDLKNVNHLSDLEYEMKFSLGKHNYSTIWFKSVSPDTPPTHDFAFLYDILENFAARATKTLRPGQDKHDLMSFNDGRVYEDMELIALAGLFTAGGLQFGLFGTPLLNVRAGRFVPRNF